IVRGNLPSIKIIQRLPIILAFPQNRLPTQTSLRAFENQKFKQPAIVVDGRAPFTIMIRNRQLGLRPPTSPDPRLPIVSWICHSEVAANYASYHYNQMIRLDRLRQMVMKSRWKSGLPL